MSVVGCGRQSVFIPFPLPDAISCGKAAKILGAGRTRFFSMLRQIAWITRKNEPYQWVIEAGYLDVELAAFNHPTQGLKETVTTIVTGKGLEKLKRMRLFDEQRKTA